MPLCNCGPMITVHTCLMASPGSSHCSLWPHTGESPGLGANDLV